MNAYMKRMLAQFDLFKAKAKDGPDGLRYLDNVLSEAEENAAIRDLAALDLKPFVFHSFLGKRRVASFGWRYDYQSGGLQRAADMPSFVLGLRERAAKAAEIAPGDFAQALVTEYALGAGIGWHRDKPHFGKVAALSLGAPCGLRFRRRRNGGWERRTLSVAPRSFYLLDGDARSIWEHSIAPMPVLRYSVTFRTLVDRHA